VPFAPESDGDPAGSPLPPDDPDEPPSEPCWDPSEPCCDPSEPWLPPPDAPPDDGEPEGLDGLDEPELPLGEEGACGPDPPLPPDEDGDEGDDEDDPPDGDGIPLGMELDVVVLQPDSVTATATANSVEKPGKRCMVGPSACARSDESSPALPTWMRRATSGSLSALRERCRHPPRRGWPTGRPSRPPGHRPKGTTAVARSAGRRPCDAPA
jgi:hypothetical protein